MIYSKDGKVYTLQELAELSLLTESVILASGYSKIELDTDTLNDSKLNDARDKIHDLTIRINLLNLHMQGMDTVHDGFDAALTDITTRMDSIVNKMSNVNSDRLAASDIQNTAYAQVLSNINDLSDAVTVSDYSITDRVDLDESDVIASSASVSSIYAEATAIIESLNSQVKGITDRVDLNSSDTLASSTALKRVYDQVMRSQKYIDSLDTLKSVGVPGTQGFGVGVAPTIPEGFTELIGTNVVTSSNYGNYQYKDGSIMVWIPAFYYRITDRTEIAISHFDSPDAAIDAGYVLHRAFINGGTAQPGVFVDKYLCSSNSGVPSSIKNGIPILTSDCESFELSPTVSSIMNLPKRRGTEFFCNSIFIHSALAMLAMSHGQNAANSTFCGWYDLGNVTNYPKGNTGSLSDIDDSVLSFIDDGRGYALTGSSSTLSRTSHNGQTSGIQDLSNVLGEYLLGITTPGLSSDDVTYVNKEIFTLKTSVSLSRLTGDWNDRNSIWGDQQHVDDLYTPLDVTHLPTGNIKLGAPDVSVLSSASVGAGFDLTNVGLPHLSDGTSDTGLNLFGLDEITITMTSNLVAKTGGANALGGSGVGINSRVFRNAMLSDEIGSFRIARYL